MQLMSNTHVPNTSPPQQGLITDAENKYTGRNELSRAKPDLLTSSGQTSVLFYKGLFGSIRIQTRTRMEKTSCDKAKRAISRSKSIVIAPSFARSVFELRSEDCLGHMSRTVTSFPVLPHEAEIFNWFHSNKFDRIIDALNRREISPFVRDPRGWTLLHYACFTSSVEICSMLIQVGVDVDHQDYGVCKAMSFIEVNSRGKNKASLEDLTRAVLSAQDDITLADISTFFWAYLWLSQWCQLSVVADFLTSTFTLCSYPSWGYDSYEWCLRIALSEWGRGDRDKRVVVRKLLCQGINIHAIETSEHVNHIVPVRESDVLTPLDYLFQSLTDPFCNDGIGREWLLMLAEVGYDVRAYLEKEKKLHASQCLRTSEAYVKNGNTCDLCSRQLIFQIGSYPNVRWDWWIDPSSAASLVRKEFRYINIRNTLSDSWEDTWPFEYPAWSEYCEPIGHMYPVESDTAKRTACEQKVALARSRLARRARKKYPDYYSKQNPMPGAWVEDVFEG